MNSLNIFLHCANFVMFSAVIALIVHHQTVLLNAESNSTSKGQNEANETALFKKINATDKKDEGQKVLLLLKQKQRQHFGEEKTVNWSSNITSINSSSASSSIPFSETKKANRGNNCTTTTAHFGEKNSTKKDKQKREKRRKREADSTVSVEHFSTENGKEKDESGRLSSETSSGAEEKEEAKKNSSEANGEGKGRERDETEGGGGKEGGDEEEEDNEEEEGKEENWDSRTNCGNGELLLMMAPKEGEVADAIVKKVKNGSEETPKGTKLTTEKGNGTVESEENYGKWERNGRKQTVATEKGKGTVENGTNERRRKRENTQDLVRQANAQLQNAFGNAQTMVQQQQQMPSQIIQLPSMDLSNGKAQNVLLISDSGNVSMSRGLHFLTVSTVLQQ